ncbi:hypothetical protein CAP36_00075 [Chitinophagaceae bacterium IBVUCB2]|nr:hypothetical protein CAP36_00075 [Chitinophagaceae bacterium IBVUCB2]
MGNRKNICWRFFLCLLLLFISPCIAFSQTPKGLIVAEKDSRTQGKTKALIVGISKYQFIDSLQYADRDAQVFADYLATTGFWNITKDDITLLVNEKAKRGDLITQLTRIASSLKPGDNLLFFFSGHGDVESPEVLNKGYLLTNDTYSDNYWGGAVAVNDLKDVFVTLLSRDIKVILITDACRSGKLAGGIKGAEFAAAAISSMWKNEIKILSSQPGQLSYEDKKWGNGRGVFSYFLINGLNGEADTNKDSTITLAELEMYVGSNVAKETNNKQQPIFEGPNKFSTVLATLKAPVIKPVQKTGGNSIKGKSYYQVPDDSCNYYFKEMTKAIDKKKFGFTGQGSATVLYRQLKACTNDTDFILQANSELLAALMNNAQEIVNNSFIGKKLVSERQFEEGVGLIEQVLQNNDLRLPNEKYLQNLKRYLFVQGKATWFHETSNKVPAEKLSIIIDSAIKEEPEAAYLLTAKAVVEMRKENWTKAIQLLEKAISKSPGWLIPKYQLGSCYASKKNYAKAIEYYEAVLQKDPHYNTFECTKCILQNLAQYAIELKQIKKAADYLLKSIELFPDDITAYFSLYDYAIESKDTAVAESLISKLKLYNDSVEMRLLRIRFENQFAGIPLSLISLDSVRLILRNNHDSGDYYYTLGKYYQEEVFDADSAEFFYRKAVELVPAEFLYLQTLAEYIEENGDAETAQQLLIEKMEAYEVPDKYEVMSFLASSYLNSDKMREAFALLREIKEAGYFTCADLKSLKKAFKNLPEYTAYIKNCRDK